MSIFDNRDIENARGTQGNPYPLPGKYAVDIARCKEGKNRKGVDFFVAELLIVESNNPERKPGTHMDYYVGLDKDPALGNIADFMRVGLSAFAMQKHNTPIEPKDVQLDKATADKVTGEENMLIGVRINAEAYNKPTKAGNDFTRVKWMVP
jgi:hypothetical protein